MRAEIHEVLGTMPEILGDVSKAEALAQGILHELVEIPPALARTSSLSVYASSLALTSVISAILDRNFGWVFLYGSPGSGKSHAIRMVSSMIGAPKPVTAINLGNFLNTVVITSGYEGLSSHRQEQLFLPHTSFPILGVDEILKNDAREVRNLVWEWGSAGEDGRFPRVLMASSNTIRYSTNESLTTPDLMDRFCISIPLIGTAPHQNISSPPFFPHIALLLHAMFLRNHALYSRNNPILRDERHVLLMLANGLVIQHDVPDEERREGIERFVRATQQHISGHLQACVPPDHFERVGSGLQALVRFIRKADSSRDTNDVTLEMLKKMPGKRYINFEARPYQQLANLIIDLSFLFHRFNDDLVRSVYGTLSLENVPEESVPDQPGFRFLLALLSTAGFFYRVWSPESWISIAENRDESGGLEYPHKLAVSLALVFASGYLHTNSTEFEELLKACNHLVGDGGKKSGNENLTGTRGSGQSRKGEKQAGIGEKEQAGKSRYASQSGSGGHVASEEADHEEMGESYRSYLQQSREVKRGGIFEESPERFVSRLEKEIMDMVRQAGITGNPKVQINVKNVTAVKSLDQAVTDLANLRSGMIHIPTGDGWLTLRVSTAPGKRGLSGEKVHLELFAERQGTGGEPEEEWGIPWVSKRSIDRLIRDSLRGEIFRHLLDSRKYSEIWERVVQMAMSRLIGEVDEVVQGARQVIKNPDADIDLNELLSRSFILRNSVISFADGLLTSLQDQERKRSRHAISFLTSQDPVHLPLTSALISSRQPGIVFRKPDTPGERRNIEFVIDCSGSMYGFPQTVTLLTVFSLALRSEGMISLDRPPRIVLFDSAVRADSALSEASNIRDWLSILFSIEADGGTSYYNALHYLLNARQIETQESYLIVVGDFLDHTNAISLLDKLQEAYRGVYAICTNKIFLNPEEALEQTTPLFRSFPNRLVLELQAGSIDDLSGSFINLRSV